MGKEFQRRAKAMILRAAVLRNQIHVKVRNIIVHSLCYVISQCKYSSKYAKHTLSLIVFIS